MEFTHEPLDPFGEELIAVEVESNLTYKMPLVFRCVQLLQKSRCVNPALREMAELCFDEALANAMVHGNRLDPSKRVFVSLFHDDERWGAIIEDEGPGLKPDNVPDPEEADILRDTGRGIALMDNYLDALRFSEKGNRLMMVRHREAGEEAPVQEPEEEAPGPLMEDGMLVFEQPAQAPPVAGHAEEPAGFSATTKRGEVAVFEILESRLSDANVATFKQDLDAVIAENKLILVDMNRVEYISSAILGAFAHFVKQVQAKKGALKVCSAQPVVFEVFKAMRFHKLLDVRPDREAGLASFG